MSDVRTFTISFLGHEGQRVKLTRTFADMRSMSARERAEGFAYTISHKAECDIQEVGSDSGLDADYDATTLRGAPF